MISNESYQTGISNCRKRLSPPFVAARTARSASTSTSWRTESPPPWAVMMVFCMLLRRKYSALLYSLRDIEEKCHTIQTQINSCWCQCLCTLVRLCTHTQGL